MKTEDVHEGLRALLDEALAVSIGEIDENEMTMPTELENLIRVATFEEEGILSANPGLVLRFNCNGKTAEFQLGIVRSR